MSLDSLETLADCLQSLAPAGRSQRRSRWLATARPEQVTPEGDWNVWLILAGRGWGKTRTGAEDVAHYGQTHPGVRIAVAAPTYADARDTCIEGESGLLSVLEPSAIDTWNRSLGELILTNETRYKLFSADEPERFRGPQHHRAWVDELAAWRYPESLDQLVFGLRLGDLPQLVATTTPRPVRMIRELLARQDVRVTRGSTFDNRAHLAPAALAQLEARYANTTLGRQELYAEILDEMPGALWTRNRIDADRMPDDPEAVELVVASCERIVVAIDPAVTSGEDSDETGIIVAGRAHNRGYVLEDLSGRYTPDGWARLAVDALHRWKADRVIGEANNGGDLVETVLRTIDPALPYRKVTASRGKRVRAEPVAALYEQGRVHHVGLFADLEDQMCSWTPESDVSPDRMDALVWAMTELLGAGHSDAPLFS